MKKLFVVGFILFITAQSFAQDKAKIIVIRDNGYIGTLGDFKIFLDEKMTCRISNKSYTIHEIEVGTGKHSITVQSIGTEMKKEGIKGLFPFEVEAGKTYYFEMQIKKQLMAVEVTENTGKKLMTDLKEDTDCFK